jgi:hypothetical protein
MGKIYEEGLFADCIVTFKGHTFKLHRMILAQSPFFMNLFSGDWSDSKETNVDLSLDDPLINYDSLRIIFRAMYCADIAGELQRTVTNTSQYAVLASASLLMLHEYVQLTVKLIASRLSPQDLPDACEVASMYSSSGLTEALVHYVRVNFERLPHRILFALPLSFLANVLNSSAVFVSSEIDRYMFCRAYVTYCLEQKKIERSDATPHHDSLSNDDDCEGDSSAASASSDQAVDAVSSSISGPNHNMSFSAKKKTAFLLTAAGEQFTPLFDSLHYGCLALERDVELLTADNIVCPSWILQGMLLATKVRKNVIHRLGSDSSADPLRRMVGRFAFDFPDIQQKLSLVRRDNTVVASSHVVHYAGSMWKCRIDIEYDSEQDGHPCVVDFVLQRLAALPRGMSSDDYDYLRPCSLGAGKHAVRFHFIVLGQDRTFVMGDLNAEVEFKPNDLIGLATFEKVVIDDMIRQGYCAADGDLRIVLEILHVGEHAL